MSAIKISASILGSDLSQLNNEIKKVENANVDMIHFDVMDGIFVNNISFGAPLLKSIRKCTNLIMDVHLMITQPHRYIDDFVKAGADIITIHYEAENDLRKTLEYIKKSSVKAGLSVKPGTDIKSVLPYLDVVDMILVMAVEPGFGGQGLIIETFEKVKFISQYIKDNNLSIDVQIDGGINDKTCEQAVKSGANVLVSGSYLFNAEDVGKAVKILSRKD